MWDAVLGLCLIQNKTKPNNHKQNGCWPTAVPCLCQANGLPWVLALGKVEEEEEDEERHSGVSPKLHFEGGVGRPTCGFV